MSMAFQVGRRTTRVSRFNRSGPKAVRLLLAYRPAGCWDANDTSSVTLNGTDVSAMAPQGQARPWQPVTLTLSQAVAGSQPLYTGAAALNGLKTIEFTAANNDELAKATVDVSNIGPMSFIAGAKMTVNGSIMSNSNGVGSGNTIRTDNRTLQNLGGGGRTFTVGGALDTTAAHGVFVSQDAGENRGRFVVDGAVLTAGASGTVGAAPGAAAALHLGSIAGALSVSMNYQCGAWYIYDLGESLAQRLSMACKARVG